MMETARTSETLVNFYQTTRCYNPEDSNLHTHRRENLKSYLPYTLRKGCVMDSAVVVSDYSECSGRRHTTSDVDSYWEYYYVHIRVLHGTDKGHNRELPQKTTP
jgi:hypothetical protein